MSDQALPKGGTPGEAVDLSELPHDSIGEAVVSVVAAYTGRTIQELDSLVEAIDPDALETLCREEMPGSPERLRTIRFEYQGLLVSISQCEQLRIRPLGAPAADNGDRRER